ncbi:MAG: TolC family protein [Bacteroidales bacterium]
MKRRWICLGMIIVFLSQAGLNAQNKLSLEDCGRLALENNEKLKIAQERLVAATSMRKSAFTQYLPNFSANASYLRTNRQFNLLGEDKFLPVIPFNAIDAQNGGLNQQAFSDPAIASGFLVFDAQGQPVFDEAGNPVFKQYVYLPKEEGELGSKNVYVAQIGLVQPLFTGFKIRETNRIAAYTEQLAIQKKLYESSELLHKVEESFWQIIALEEKQKLAQAYLDLLENLSVDLRNLYQEGFVTHNDLLKVDVKKNEASLALFKVNQGLKLSKMALAQLIGIDLEENIVLVPVQEDDFSLITQDQLYALARENRTELQMLEQQINISRSGVKIMKSRYLPDLAASVNYVVSNPNLYNGYEEQFSGDIIAGVALHIPLFHWGDKNHTLKAARHGQRIAELELKQATEWIQLEVAQAFFAWQESLERIKMTESGCAQAEENLRLNQDNYNEGLVTTTDLLEAQAMWQKASADHIEAKTAQWICQSQLKKVGGKLVADYSKPETLLGP